MDKLEQIKKRIEEIQNKSAVTNEMRAFITLVLSIVTEHKQDLTKLSNENIEKITETLLYIEDAQKQLKNDLESYNFEKITKLEQDTKKTLEKALKALETVSSIEVKDGIDGKDGVDGIDGKDGKDGSPDTGEEIVAKINELPVEPDYQIDAKHIKNLPTGKGVGGSTARNLYQLQDTNIQEGKVNEVLQLNSDGVWENGIAITVSATEPTNPKQFDLWLDIS